jgi:short-subunit dehydrogenase
MDSKARRLAVVTAASSGIGLDLARLCAQNNYDLVIAAQDAAVFDAAEELAAHGITVSPVRCDLSTPEGVDALRKAITACGKPADILVANAGHEALATDASARLNDARAYIEGTIDLIDQVSRSMRGRGHGRILITYSIAGLASDKVFLGSFTAALCRELKHSGVTVSCLAAGAGALGIFEHRACTEQHQPALAVPLAQTSVVAYQARMASPIPVQSATS